LNDGAEGGDTGAITILLFLKNRVESSNLAPLN
jgi:hypothetical protein